MSEKRSTDAYQTQLRQFMHEVLIVCPQCERQAMVKAPVVDFSAEAALDIRLICVHCGHSKMLTETPDTLFFTNSSGKQVRGRTYLTGGAVDPYFHLPLWLTTKVEGHLLWAYNHDHLAFLEQHIRATLRERSGPEYSNRSVGSRLPKWMTSRKNRDKVLKAIVRLQESHVR